MHLKNEIVEEFVEPIARGSEPYCVVTGNGAQRKPCLGLDTRKYSRQLEQSAEFLREVRDTGFDEEQPQVCVGPYRIVRPLSRAGDRFQSRTGGGRVLARPGHLGHVPSPRFLSRQVDKPIRRLGSQEVVGRFMEHAVQEIT